MKDDLWEEFWYYLNIPDSKWEKIKSENSSWKERKQAAIDDLITSHPAPSWRLVARALYQRGYDSCHEALIKQQELFPKGNVCRSGGCTCTHIGTCVVVGSA